MQIATQVRTEMRSLMPRWGARFREPSLVPSLVEFALTVMPCVAYWLLMLASLRYSYVSAS